MLTHINYSRTIHIMSRHYYPNMNLEAGISLNSGLSIINMEELPISVLNLIKQHTSFSYLTQKTEFLLFEIDGEKYIIWIKFNPSLTGKIIFHKFSGCFV